MKTLNITDEVHDQLRIKAIHQKKKLGELANEILSSNIDSPTTPTKD